MRTVAHPSSSDPLDYPIHVLVTGAGGKILDRFATDVPFSIGDVMDLVSGDQVEVLQLQEEYRTTDWLQVLYVTEAVRQREP